MTIGSKDSIYGDRIVAIGQSGSYAKFYASGSISGNKNYYKYIPPLNQWTTVDVEQKVDGDKYMSTFKVGGIEVFSVDNLGPTVFPNVKVYVSNPWDSAQPGKLRNLFIGTSDLVAGMPPHARCPADYTYTPGLSSTKGVIDKHKGLTIDQCRDKCNAEHCCASFLWSPAALVANGDACYLNSLREPDSAETGDWIFCRRDAEAAQARLRVDSSHSACTSSELQVLDSCTRHVNNRKNLCGGMNYCSDRFVSKRRTADWKGSKWYRFDGKAGGRMAEGPQGVKGCGTLVTGYISTGNHPSYPSIYLYPSVANGQQCATFNFEYGSSTTNMSNEGLVVNCGNFFIYKLKDMGEVKGYCGTSGAGAAAGADNTRACIGCVGKNLTGQIKFSWTVLDRNNVKDKWKDSQWTFYR